MDITLRIQRFNPETDDAPYFQDYAVNAEPTDRVLDALMYLKDYVDGSLAFRRSCAHGVCGSDAMVIDGQEELAMEGSESIEFTASEKRARFVSFEDDFYRDLQEKLMAFTPHAVHRH